MRIVGDYKNQNFLSFRLVLYIPEAVICINRRLSGITQELYIRGNYIFDIEKVETFRNITGFTFVLEMKKINFKLMDLL